MAKIKPFKAVIYNQQKIQDLSLVVCPPYDIISPAKQDYYHGLNPYNFIHILLGKDSPNEDKYQRAGMYFKNWLKEGIFIQDDKPAIYFYTQHYNLRGEKKTRTGFIALLHLEDKNSSIFPHEHTRLEPKMDRLRLLEEVKANLSPIFVLFSDKKRIIQQINQNYISKKKPFISVVDEDKILNELWRIDSPEIIEQICKKMSDANIFIADGHHRYEVASIYREKMSQVYDSMTGEEDFNYIMSYFTNIESPGLTILPIHRLVKVDSVHNLKDLHRRLSEYFELQSIKDKERFFFLKEKAGRNEHVLGMYRDNIFWLLRLKNVKILDKIILDKSFEYRRLDISILNYIILENILGLNPHDQNCITFSPDAEEIIKKVNSNDSYIGFFLNPVKVQQLISVALNEERMPPKSTYFYPKLLSGLVINKFNL